MIRKQSLKTLEAVGELKEFTYVSLIEPSKSSFSVSIGLSLLESLVRLKSCPEIAHNTWVSIFTSISQTRSLSFDWSLSEKHSEFRKIFEQINNSDRKQSLKILNSIYKDFDKLLAIDYGMRFLIHKALDVDVESILKGNFNNYTQVAKCLSEMIKVGIGIGYKGQLKEFRTNSVAPMIFIYLRGKDQFGVLYHRAAKYVDEKGELTSADCSIYPFTTEREEKRDVSYQVDTQAVIDLIEILAENLRDRLPISVKKHIQEKVAVIAEKMPMIKEISALLQIDLEENGSRRKDVSEDSDSGFRLYSTHAIATNTNYTTGSLINKKKILTPSPRKKKKYSSNDYYSQITNINLTKVKCCKFCKKMFNVSEFTLVSCPTHTICIKCRTVYYNRGDYNCPECFRSYTIREHNLLRINDSSKRATATLMRFM